MDIKLSQVFIAVDDHDRANSLNDADDQGEETSPNAPAIGRP
jgi:hypothetical protein